MRILFQSKSKTYKNPFGVLTEGESCRLRLDIPKDVGALRAEVILECDGRIVTFSMTHDGDEGPYQHFCGTVQLQRGLYFYYFKIDKPCGSFRLFKQGNDTNMEAGDLWQVSVIPADAKVPAWARGAVIYQIYPDRYAQAGTCDLTGKLEPYTIHASWEELPDWRPNEQGEITNSDFFGGNLKGITEKLPALAELGVEILYLNPIFKAWSNHRYDTADYNVIDPMLGIEEDFVLLCETAHRLGMHVLLDGVFSHTGDRNTLFQQAISDPESPYRSWYQFRTWPDEYESWWGIRTLPCLNKTDPGYLNYLVRDPDSVVARWLRLGADGWRLDVADELPDSLIRMIKTRMREEKPDALLMGEVWEDASNKVAYDQRKRYFVDGELDSVMNYPFKNAIIAYVTGKDDGFGLRETVETIQENYPKEVLECCMNLLSTHDTARILTVLGGGGTGSREVEAVQRLTEQQRQNAKQRLKIASFLQFTLPGAPAIYYGDEAGMEGGKDPFNRQCYPWGREDPELMQHYRALCALRKGESALRTGELQFLDSGAGRIAFQRADLQIYVNLSEADWFMGPGMVRFCENFDADKRILHPGGYMLLKI